MILRLAALISPSWIMQVYHDKMQKDKNKTSLTSVYKNVFSEPRTTILGNKELFIEAGSTINLTCIIQAGKGMSDTHIFWNYDGKVRVPWEPTM